MATLGTTSSTAVDPLPAIARICRQYNLWFHIDAAMSGTAAICPEFRPPPEGVELADSYCFNPHKWMLVNFDCSVLYLADREHLVRSLSIQPEYLKNLATESGEVIDYRDWHVQLGRRFRALKLWLVIRSFGVEGLRRNVREHIELARLFADWVRSHQDYELMAPVHFNLVCFRHRAGNAFNQRLLEMINQSGQAYISHTKLNGIFTLRLSVGQEDTADAMGGNFQEK
jgi:aromatic-L-amino-acid decarboxylase